MRKLNEECGVFGVTGIKSGEAAGIIYNGLLSLQHRGQESVGIAVVDNNSIYCAKDQGLISEVFNDINLAEIPRSSLGIGHVRYSTTGGNSKENAQPIVTEYFMGRLSVAHNGNIVNAKPLRERLESYGILFTTSNDSEVISALIAYERLKTNTMEEAVFRAVKQIQGAYSLVILSGDKLIAVRDPAGFRPLCLGKGDNGAVAVSSESCGLDSVDLTFIRDIKPGEIVSIDTNGNEASIFFEEKATKGLCIFEYVYFARTDSIIDNMSVYKARSKAGRILAQESPVDADIVCGVPDSGLEAAQGFAEVSGIPYGSAFVKNRYIGRSFIYPTQEQRKSAVKIKLNPLKAVVNGKRVILVDDSIVRGTTSANIIEALKGAGAKEVHLRISSPPFIHKCHFGTDIDDEDNLIANNLSLEGIAKQIGADSLAYISVDGLKKACNDASISFCTGCFTGKYPIEINTEYL